MSGVNGSLGELTYVYLQVGIGEGSSHVLSSNGLERPWSDQDAQSNFLCVPMEGFGRRSGMNMNVLRLGTVRKLVWLE